MLSQTRGFWLMYVTGQPILTALAELRKAFPAHIEELRGRGLMRGQAGHWN